MSAAEEIPVVTFAEFLASEELGDRRHEFVSGRVYLMAGGTERHDLTTEAVYSRLVARARVEGCRRFFGNRLVRLDGDAYYPDVMVVRSPAADRRFERDLNLAVEVLSPSTEHVDRREKAGAYARAPSFEQYLLVDPERRRIEAATRGADGLQWRVFGPGSIVVTRFGDLDVDELYDEVDATATT
jgi:Uma2 family endonuclease